MRVKRGTAEDVQRIFQDQNTGTEDIPLVPRSEGWKVVKEELEQDPGGMAIQKTTRVRTFGRLNKLAFVYGFMDELAKIAAPVVPGPPNKVPVPTEGGGITYISVHDARRVPKRGVGTTGWERVKKGAEKPPQHLPLRGKLGGEKTGSEQVKVAFIGKLVRDYIRAKKISHMKNVARHGLKTVGHLGAAALAGAAAVHAYHALKHKKSEQSKSAGENVPMLVEPHRRGEVKEVRDDPFYQLRKKIKIVSGRERGTSPAGPVTSLLRRRLMGMGVPK